jgi:ATP-dependent RNA helicase
MASTSRKPNTNNEDLSNVEFETSEDVEVLPTFQSMKLREELLRGIYAYGKFYISVGKKLERRHNLFSS